MIFSKKQKYYDSDIRILYDKIEKLEHVNMCREGQHEWQLSNRGFTPYRDPAFSKDPIPQCKWCYKWHTVELNQSNVQESE